MTVLAIIGVLTLYVSAVVFSMALLTAASRADRRAAELHHRPQQSEASNGSVVCRSRTSLWRVP